MLEIKNLTVGLPQSADRENAVTDLSIKVRAGKTLCIVGESGSGKSVTAYAIMQLLDKRSLEIKSGEILYDGIDLTKQTESSLRKIRGKEISMVFQEPMTALNPLMTVGDQIKEVLINHNIIDKDKIKDKIIEVLSEMHLPEPERLRHCYPFQLSGGQRQRVMIAIAMVSQPKLLIADEPTTALDVTTQAQILKLINDLKDKRNIGVVFITHDFGVVSEIADEVVVMQKGIIVEKGSTQEIFGNAQHEYTKHLLSSVPDLNTNKKVDLSKNELLSAINLNKTYRSRSSGGWFKKSERKFVALNDVSFSIYEGETLGVLGESGSGKTTLGYSIARLLKIDSGQIIYKNQSLDKLESNELRKLRSKIQMIFQDPYSSLNPRHKISRIITENAVINGISIQEANRRMHEILEFVGIDSSAADRYPHEFSGGQKQRIGIARALVLEPSLIIADEPVSALDVSVQKQVLELLKEVKSRYNLSMLFITHDLRVASEISDRIIVMNKGQIVECNSVSEIYRNTQHPYTKSLLESMPSLPVKY